MSVKVCSIDGCGKRVNARGWCAMHYKRWKNHGDPLYKKPVREYDGPACSIPGCELEATRRGWCSTHYKKALEDPDYFEWREDVAYDRLVASGVLTSGVKSPDGACLVDDCEASEGARGLCGLHYNRARRDGSLSMVTGRLPSVCIDEQCESRPVARGLCQKHYAKANASGGLPPRMNRKDGPCTEPDCDRPAHAQGLCGTHYQRARAHGKIERITEQPICTVDECDGDAVVRGLCGKHDQRVRKYGDPDGGLKRDTIVIDDEHKTCSKCEEVKHASDFGPAKRGKLGRAAVCYECNNRRWREDPDFVIAKKRGRQKRKARLREAETYYISKRDLERLLSSPCFACGTLEDITFDHVIPVKLRGRHSIGNALPLCVSCNASKQDKLLIEWLPGRREWLNGRQGGRRVA